MPVAADVDLFREVGQAIINSLDAEVKELREERDDLSRQITEVQARIDKVEARQLAIMGALEAVPSHEPKATPPLPVTDVPAKNTPKKPNVQLLDWITNYTRQYTRWVVIDMSRDAEQAKIGDYRTVYKTISDRMNYMCRRGQAVRLQPGVYESNGTQ